MESTGTPPLPETTFLGVRITTVGLEAAADLLAARPPGAPFAYVVTPNAQHVVRLSRGDARFAEGYAGAWLRLCDGQSVRLMARLSQGQQLPLATGADLTALLFRRVIRPDDPLTVIGGNQALAERLRQQFALTDLALHEPPMGFYNQPADVARCIDFVLAHPARFVFLAVGAPQSEVLARRLQQQGGVTGTGLCIGSSLHFLTGMTRRAPLAFRRLGLEWLFRLLMNPRRHASRVFKESLPLLWLAARERLRGGRG